MVCNIREVVLRIRHILVRIRILGFVPSDYRIREAKKYTDPTAKIKISHHVCLMMECSRIRMRIREAQKHTDADP